MDFYSDSKRNLKLPRDYCIKFQVFLGAQDIFSRLMAVCFMLLQPNSNRLRQHYKRHSVGPRIAVNIDFVDVSDF